MQALQSVEKTSSTAHQDSALVSPENALQRSARLAASMYSSKNTSFDDSIMGLPPTISSGAGLAQDAGINPQVHRSKILVMTALCIAIFLVSLDTVIITTALPSITAQFGSSDSGFAWTGSAYLLTNAAFVPFWGNVSDVFGRKPVLMLANALFLTGSVMSALSQNIGMLIAGRAVQGLGGGGIGVCVNICVSDLFKPRTRSLMLGMIGAVWAVSCALGPIIGGAFTEKVGWRWCFWINLPIDALCVLILLIFLDIKSPKTSFWDAMKLIDWIGTTTIVGATVMLLLGLQFGGVAYSWSSATVICLLVSGALAFFAFFVSQFRVSPNPIMPFSIFSHYSNLSALGVTFFDAFVFNSTAYFLPLYFQSVLNSSPLRSGVLMLPMAVPLCLFSASAGWIMQRTGRFLELLKMGLLLMTLGMGLLISLPDHLDLARLVPFSILIGIGFGPNFHAPLIALQTRLRDEDMAAGIATFGFVRMLSGAIGIVLCQVIFQSSIHHSHGELASSGFPASVLNDVIRGVVTFEPNEQQDLLNPTQRALLNVAKAKAMSRVWTLLCIASFCGLLISMGIKKARLKDDDEGCTERTHT